MNSSLINTDNTYNLQKHFLLIVYSQISFVLKYQAYGV